MELGFADLGGVLVGGAGVDLAEVFMVGGGIQAGDEGGLGLAGAADEPDFIG